MPGHLKLPHDQPAKIRLLKLEYPSKHCPGDVVVKEKVDSIIVSDRNNENKGTCFLSSRRYGPLQYVIGIPSISSKHSFLRERQTRANISDPIEN
jgi:hypothetical protein